MTLLRSVILAALVSSGGCAWAQPPMPPSDDLADAEDQALADARAPYRGYAPFAVAAKSPFGEREWFVLSFFEYWTGFQTSYDAKKHFLIRRVSGLRAGDVDDVDDVERPAPAAVTTWALSDSCLKLEPALARFKLRSEIEFTSDPDAPYDPKTIMIAASDFSGLSFWATLRTADGLGEVDMIVPYDESSLGRWVQQLVTDTGDCFISVQPEIPAAKVPLDPKKPQGGFSIFDFWRD